MSAVTPLGEGAHPELPPMPSPRELPWALQGTCLPFSFLISLSSPLIYLPESSFSPHSGSDIFNGIQNAGKRVTRCPQQ